MTARTLWQRHVAFFTPIPSVGHPAKYKVTFKDGDVLEIPQRAGESFDALVSRANAEVTRRCRLREGIGGLPA